MAAQPLRAGQANGARAIMDTKQAVGKSRDLHDGKSFWAATPNIVVESRDTPARTDYDVIIIGAGISGALMAQALAADGRHILVVDRREPVRGSTLASTAMIQHEIDIPLSQLSKAIGAKKAMRAWRRSAASVDSLGARVGKLGISCQFQPRSSLFLAGDEMGHRALAAEAQLRREAQLDAEYLSGAQVKERFGIERTGAILSPCSASANPAQMTAGLLKTAQQGGVEVVSPLAITAIRETRDGVMVATADGTLLCAADLIACTGYEYLKMMESPLHQVISTWAIASEPNAQRPDWLDDHLVWEASEPYLYFRSTPDGRIIAGGEDEDDPLAHQDPVKARRKFETIRQKLKDLAGIEMDHIAYGWSAPFGTTRDGLPIIDRVPGTSHVHVVMGFGGNGITFSTIASEIVSARIAGRKDADEDLFSFRS
ncbi:NAD(P)/FAD-dependent oxidoreductase [Agrobacterium vitis]|uniref:NAD(P)/FAD-dependent oxidoreductase n=1 Tax=Agrobacterium vitis TaxID=373 RepID=UPI0012E953E4|nr:FAD-binding oxidoreductase [Agrobacterium vitis]MVA64156.1 FAD-dependent oxidoreductase [Agrobacterium vitis]